ncbi:MAG: hypothetical protein ACK4NW_12850 [Roseinatronobacter sp.]
MTARIGDLAVRGALGLKIRPQTRDTGKRPDYLRAVRGLACCVCQAFGEQQRSETQAHHVFHGRFSQIKTPDTMAIPLCRDHHQGDGKDPTKLAIHRAKDTWLRRYGPDHEFTAGTQDQLARLL